MRHARDGLGQLRHLGHRFAPPTPENQKRLLQGVEWRASSPNLTRLLYLSEFDSIPVYDQGAEGACHDSATEVLTEDGWVKWGEYNGRALLGTMNTTTRLLEFQYPISVVAKDHDGPMHFIEHKSLDFALTPEHRMLQRSWDQRRKTLSDQFTFKTVQDIGWYAGLPSAPSGFVGADIRRIRIGEREYDGDDFIALTALIASDGWVGGTQSNWNTVSFCCFREDRLNKVRQLAYRLGVHEIPGRHGVWKWSDPALAVWCRSNMFTGDVYRSPFKHVPSLIKSVSSAQVALFLDFFGDQHITPRDGRRAFYSSSQRMVDDLQELLLRVGRRGAIYSRAQRSSDFGGRATSPSRDAVDLTLNERAPGDRLSIERKHDIRVDHYKGQVYCANVPNSTLITRRNGAVLISGNCTGHATREVAGHTLMKKSGQWLPLSAQFSYNMTRVEEGTPLTEDSGCAIPDAIHGFEVRGLCREELFPTDPGNLTMTPPQEAIDDARSHLGLLSFHVPDDATIAACLAQGFAVSIGISVPENLMSTYAAQTGEVSYPEPGEKILGGHNIVLIGRDPEKIVGFRTGCYRFRNSWSQGWGSSGDGWLPIDFVTDGYASDGETIRSVT